MFHLVKVNGNMILAYSPILEIADFSLPFCAYLTMLLSVVKDVPVKQTILNFPADIELDILEQKPDEDGTVSESNSDNSSDRYRLAGSRGMDGDGTTFPCITSFHVVR
jgi:hypothetical protein